MRIVLSWLQDFINLNEYDITEITQKLTDIGLEVENISKIETIRGSLEGLIVGEIISSYKHPNADRLSCVSVNIGADKAVDIVCGAPNVRVGMKCIVALPGTCIHTTKGEDIIIFYNMSNKNIISDCQNYSFINGVNGLSIMDLEKENKKVLLCACKKYTKNQKNGILLINAKTEEYQQLNTNFLDTDSFEVNCFCQISIKENNETIKTNYFLVGGLDTQKRQGIIKLCKITNNNNKFNIEFVEDIFISYIKGFEGFQQTISCIVQSTKNGKILVGCCDGKVYSFSQPNINMYLEEDKELEELDNQSTSEINYN